MIQFPQESVFRIDHEDARRGMDYYADERRAMLKESYLDAKRREAIAYLGEKWVLHPVNAVQRVNRKPFKWQEAA